MSTPFRISLKAGERLYINGAVLRASQKITLEILNDAAFLLEGHVLQPQEATTPLRQLYFTLQTRLIDPSSISALDTYHSMHEALMRSFSTDEVLVGLSRVRNLVAEERVFDALKAIRALYPLEQAILESGISGVAA